MQEQTYTNSRAFRARIKAKRVFLYWFIPLTFACAYALTYNERPYYVCSTSLSTEEMRTTDANRTLMLNRPENYDLGLANTAYSIDPDDYTEVIYSTAYLCQLLATSVTTADGSFSGSYYEYLATRYQYSCWTSFRRMLRGVKQHAPGEQLPALDAFRPQGFAIEAIGMARQSITCSVHSRTKLVTLCVKAQDPLVAAMVTQAAAEALNEFAMNYYRSKTEQLYINLQAHIAQAHDEYQAAMRSGDTARAAMLREAEQAFIRQTIILNAQIGNRQQFTTLKNVTVPTGAAGPRHLSVALVATLIIALIAMVIIGRRELVCILEQEI